VTPLFHFRRCQNDLGKAGLKVTLRPDDKSDRSPLHENPRLSLPAGLCRASHSILRSRILMTPKAVLDYLSKNEERFIEELFAYTRIPSISAQSDHADDMKRCAEWLVEPL
jgi:hypothetical protein